MKTAVVVLNATQVQKLLAGEDEQQHQQQHGDREHLLQLAVLLQGGGVGLQEHGELVVSAEAARVVGVRACERQGPVVPHDREGTLARGVGLLPLQGVNMPMGSQVSECRVESVFHATGLTGSAISHCER